MRCFFLLRTLKFFGFSLNYLIYLICVSHHKFRFWSQSLLFNDSCVLFIFLSHFFYLFLFTTWLRNHPPLSSHCSPPHFYHCWTRNIHLLILMIMTRHDISTWKMALHVLHVHEFCPCFAKYGNLQPVLESFVFLADLIFLFIFFQPTSFVFYPREN